MIVGSIAAAAMGTAFPAFAFIWGHMTDSFKVPSVMMVQAKSTMFTFIYVGIGAFFAGWLMFACWMITGERQAISCRRAYLRSLLRQ
jgi:ATP-binding cassette subfamily B (MDR/TAP) protein 1